MAVYCIGVLDIAEIILLCAVALRIARYALKTGYHFHSFPYMQINGLGWEMINRGDFLVTLLMESFAIIHIVSLFIVIKAKIRGDSLWNSLR